MLPDHPSLPTLSGGGERKKESYLVDPASSHMLVSKTKPCMCQYERVHSETANGSINQLWFIGSLTTQVDNCGKTRANTCLDAPIPFAGERGAVIRPRPTAGGVPLHGGRPGDRLCGDSG